MKEFEPRLFQKEVFDKIASTPRQTLLQLPRHRPTYIGVDMAQAGGDKTVIAQATVDKKGKMYIFYDEYSEMPNYKWYRNPIKWWKWRTLMKRLEKQMEKYTWKSPHHS